jgi:hypothetical protein
MNTTDPSPTISANESLAPQFVSISEEDLQNKSFLEKTSFYFDYIQKKPGESYWVMFGDHPHQVYVDVTQQSTLPQNVFHKIMDNLKISYDVNHGTAVPYTTFSSAHVCTDEEVSQLSSTKFPSDIISQATSTGKSKITFPSQTTVQCKIVRKSVYLQASRLFDTGTSWKSVEKVSRIWISTDVNNQWNQAIFARIRCISGKRQARLQWERENGSRLKALHIPYIVDIYRSSPTTIDEEFCNLGKANVWASSLPQATAAQTLIPIFLKIAKTIQALHTNNLCHTDLKPQNILLTSVGQSVDKNVEPRFADLESIVNTGSKPRITTPAYTAPEQLTSKTNTATTSADIWGLGLTFYELLFGTTVKKQHFGKSASSLRSMTETLAISLSQVVCKDLSTQESSLGTLSDITCLISSMLQESPGKRPSADHIVERLEALCQIVTLQSATEVL